MPLVPLCIAIALAAPGQAAAVDPISPQAYRDQARRCDRLLNESLVAFYLPAGVDRARGGYFEAHRGGQFVASGEKFLVMQARQTWFFSTLAIEGIRKDESLAAAKHGFDFLESRMRDRAHGGYYAKVGDDGTRKDPRKHVYLNAFALYALVAYHRASGDPAALEAAKDLFHILETKAHDDARGGYAEFFSEDWRPIVDPEAPGYVGAIGLKTYNTHLHVLEAYAALLRAWPDALVRRRLEELVAINVVTVRHPEMVGNLDAWTPDWHLDPTPKNLRASYGHDVECAWLVLDAVAALGQPEARYRTWAESIVGNALKYARDREHGGLYYAGLPGRPADDTRKEWWVQAEALPGTLALHQLDGSRSSFEAFVTTLDFIEAHQVAPGGGWFATRQADGSPRDDSLSSPWQCAYHSGRALIVSRRRLDALAEGRPGPPR